MSYNSDGQAALNAVERRREEAERLDDRVFQQRKALLVDELAEVAVGKKVSSIDLVREGGDVVLEIRFTDGSTILVAPENAYGEAVLKVNGISLSGIY